MDTNELVAPAGVSARRAGSLMSKRARWFIAAAIIEIALAFLIVQLMRSDTERDLVVYYDAAMRLRAGGAIYHPAGTPVTDFPYVYPPHFVAVLTLLPAMSAVAFARLWITGLVLAYWAAATALCRIAIGTVRPFGTLVAGALLALMPGVVAALQLGQADVLVWTLIALAVAFPPLTGAGLTAAAGLKVFGGFALFAALVRRDWRTMRQAVATALALTLIAAAVFGPGRLVEECATWVLQVLPTLSSGEDYTGTLSGAIITHRLPGNLSISGAVLRALWPAHDTPAWARAAVMLWSVLAPLTVAWVGRRWQREHHYMATIAAALLAAPIFRLTYLPALAPLAALAWRKRFAPAVTRSIA